MPWDREITKQNDENAAIVVAILQGLWIVEMRSVVMEKAWANSQGNSMLEPIAGGCPAHRAFQTFHWPTIRVYHRYSFQ